jgi:hypothetical protein
MVRQIRTRAELAAVVTAGAGYLYNDFGGGNPKMCPIHAVRCPWVKTMLNVADGRLSVSKLWSDSLPELVQAVRDHGKVFTFCGSERDLADMAAAASNAAAATRSEERTSKPTRATPRASAARAARPLGSAPRDGMAGPRPYHIEIAPGARGPLEVWSVQRLPFEPKGELKDLRGELGAAAATLHARDGEHLHSVYSSASLELVDSENVLFYNVGTGRFGDAARCGLRFERAYQPPPPSPPGTVRGAEHYCRYEVVAADAPFVHWQAGPSIARWQGVACPPLHEFARASEIWLACRRAQIETTNRVLGPQVRFGVRIGVRAGSGGTRNVAAFVKPLLDGLVASLQHHDGSDVADLAARLGEQLGEPPDLVRRLLTAPGRSPLGRTRLLWRWGKPVQWNPADDRCVAARVEIETGGGPGARWSLDGEIFEVREVRG